MYDQKIHMLGVHNVHDINSPLGFSLSITFFVFKIKYQFSPLEITVMWILTQKMSKLDRGSLLIV